MPMLDVGPTTRWRITTGLLSLLIVLAAEEKVCPTRLGAPSAAQQLPDADPYRSDSPGKPGQKPAPIVIEIGATIPDGLVPRVLDQTSELAIARDADAALRLVATGPFDPQSGSRDHNGGSSTAGTAAPPGFAAEFNGAAPPPSAILLWHGPRAPHFEWIIGQSVTPTGPPHA